MRILFLTHYFHPEGNAPASRVLEMARTWVAEGHSVTVVTCAPSVPNGVVYSGYRNRLRQEETVEGIRVIRVWSYIRPERGTLQRGLGYLSFMLSGTFFSLFLQRPDVVIATSPQFFCGWAGVLVSALRRIPFVLEIRDLWPESIIAVGADVSSRTIRALEWLEARMYRAADRIVTVGPGYRSRLIEKGVPAGKIDVVTNGVDTRLFRPAPPSPEIRARYGADGTFLCAYIGTIGLACGLEVVLAAARTLKAAGDRRFRFLLVGDGAVKDDLELEAQANGLDNVIFTGLLPKQEIPDILAAADACLVHLRRAPLFATVLPSKIFEACAMKRPIILGVEGSAADVVREAGAGICIEPENAEELIAAMRRLADEPGLATDCGEAGYTYVTTRYDRPALARDYLALLRREVYPRTDPAACADEPLRRQA